MPTISDVAPSIIQRTLQSVRFPPSIDIEDWPIASAEHFLRDAPLLTKLCVFDACESVRPGFGSFKVAQMCVRQLGAPDEVVANLDALLQYETHRLLTYRGLPWKASMEELEAVALQFETVMHWLEDEAGY